MLGAGTSYTSGRRKGGELLSEPRLLFTNPTSRDSNTVFLLASVPIILLVVEYLVRVRFIR
jgi:hypothetical protein